MGADNQAERAIARIEWRERLASIFHDAYCEHQAPWSETHEKHRRCTVAGIQAVLDEINRLINERASS